MDLIYECANNFMNLVNTKYHFVFVQNRKRHDIVLDFQPSDFRHATGLHHITDIAIEKNPIKLMDAILHTIPSKISDRKLEKSKKYKEISPYSGSVRDRISRRAVIVSGRETWCTEISAGRTISSEKTVFIIP